MNKNHLSFTRLIRSFGYAFSGIRLFFRQEQNARIHLGAFVLVVAAGCFFRLSPAEWAIVAIASGAVFTAEAVNTAIEALSDALSPERSPQIKTVKDLAAGAVLLAAAAAAIAGLLIFVPKIIARL
jgi:diacylglycerol kinase